VVPSDTPGCRDTPFGNHCSRTFGFHNSITSAADGTSRDANLNLNCRFGKPFFPCTRVCRNQRLIEAALSAQASKERRAAHLGRQGFCRRLHPVTQRCLTLIQGSPKFFTSVPFSKKNCTFASWTIKAEYCLKLYAQNTQIQVIFVIKSNTNELRKLRLFRQISGCVLSISFLSDVDRNQMSMEQNCSTR
jgi:hypothetical protein